MSFKKFLINEDVELNEKEQAPSLRLDDEKGKSFVNGSSFKIGVDYPSKEMFYDFADDLEDIDGTEAAKSEISTYKDVSLALQKELDQLYVEFASKVMRKCDEAKKKLVKETSYK